MTKINDINLNPNKPINPKQLNVSNETKAEKDESVWDKKSPDSFEKTNESDDVNIIHNVTDEEYNDLRDWIMDQYGLPKEEESLFDKVEEALQNPVDYDSIKEIFEEHLGNSDIKFEDIEKALKNFNMTRYEKLMSLQEKIIMDRLIEAGYIPDTNSTNENIE